MSFVAHECIGSTKARDVCTPLSERPFVFHWTTLRTIDCDYLSKQNESCRSDFRCNGKPVRFELGTTLKERSPCRNSLVFMFRSSNHNVKHLLLAACKPSLSTEYHSIVLQTPWVTEKPSGKIAGDLVDVLTTFLGG